MKKITWASALLATLALTACGSGGSGSGVSNTGITPVTPGVTTTNPTFQGLKADGSGNAGTAVVDSAGRYTYVYNGNVIDVTLSNNRNLIQGGDVVRLTVNGVDQAIGGSNYSYSRFGGVAPKDQAEKGEVFYVGKQTVNMPTTGTAVYKGMGVGADTDGQTGVSRFSTAPMTFNVNFGQKTLSATVDIADTDGIMGQGTIVGSRFSGDLRDDALSVGSYSGAFFGPNAEELGGLGKFDPDTTHSNEGFGFSFGAKKQ